MKKTTSLIMGSVAAGAVAMVAGAELLYECTMNVPFAKKVAKKIGLQDDTMIELFKNDPLFRDSLCWFRSLKLSDNKIRNDKGEEIHGYIIENEKKSNKWAICVHGYMGSPSVQSPFVKHFYDNGYNVLCPSLRAHHKDTGKYCSMGWHDKNIVLDWIDYLTCMYPGCEIVLHGVSMGAATVMLATGEILPYNVKCAVADCGYSSCKDVFAHVMKNNMHMPSFPLLNLANSISKARGNFDFGKCTPASAVARSKTPTFFVHGTGDDFVPYRMLDIVFNACTAEKERLDIADAPHAVALAYDPDLYFSSMDSFIEKYSSVSA